MAFVFHICVTIIAYYLYNINFCARQTLHYVKSCTAAIVRTNYRGRRRRRCAAVLNKCIKKRAHTKVHALKISF